MATSLSVFEDKKLSAQFSGKARSSGTDLKWAMESEFAMQLIKKSKDLKECDPASVKESIINVALMGLSLNPLLGHCALIPRKINETYKVCALNVMYKGLIHRVTSTGAMKWAKAKVVYANEVFELTEGTEVHIKHVIEKIASKRGVMIGAYCIAKTDDGDLLIEYMDAEQINQVRSKSESEKSKYSPWNNFPEEMWKKTVIRRAWKTWPSKDGMYLEAMQAAMNKIEPSNFQEKEVEAELMLSEDQIKFFKRTTEEAGFDIEKTMDKLARSVGHTDIANVPASHFNKLDDLLTQGIESRKEKSE